MPTINELTSLSQVIATDQVPLYSATNDDARKASILLLKNYFQDGLVENTFTTQYSAPSATGFSVSITDGSENIWLILTPVAGYAAGTIVFPAVANCVDRQEIIITVTQNVTAITYDGNGATVVNGAAGLTANTSVRFKYDIVMLTWYPAGEKGATGPTGATGATGPTGATGAAGADGSTILNGAGAPGAGTGDDGDFYIDTTADAIYGPKAAGVWGAGTSLIGPTGAAGADGADGVGIPVGGTAGQALTKVDGTDYNTTWSTVGDVTTTGTQTLTNKRITKRVSTAASITSPLAWNSDNYDGYTITAQAGALTISADAGTPTDHQTMVFRIEDNGTARALTWTTGSSKAFRALGVTLPTTTVLGKVMKIGCHYDATDSRWDVVSVAQEA